MTMSGRLLFVLSLAALAAGAISGTANAQGAAPNFAGTWRCAPQPASCQNGGQTFTVTQSGNVLEIKSDNGGVGQAKLSSNTTMSVGGPWNMVGVAEPDGRIEWSNGTVWRKQ
jgi:hypothetical protein